MNSLIERVKSAMVGLGDGLGPPADAGAERVSLAIMLERAWLYWSLRDDIEGLMRDLGRLAARRGPRGRAPPARGLAERRGRRRRRRARRGRPRRRGRRRRPWTGASALQRLKLEKRLAFLGTLGNNAPFIGLLGTVIGIVGAFDELSKVKTAAAAGPVAARARGRHGAHLRGARRHGHRHPHRHPGRRRVQRVPARREGTLANTDALGHLLLAHLKADAPGRGCGREAASRRRSARPARHAASQGRDEPEESERN